MTQWFLGLIAVYFSNRYWRLPTFYVKNKLRNFSRIDCNYTNRLHLVQFLQNLLRQKYNPPRSINSKNPGQMKVICKFPISSITSTPKSCIKYKVSNFWYQISKFLFSPSILHNFKPKTEVIFDWEFVNGEWVEIFGYAAAIPHFPKGILLYYYVWVNFLYKNFGMLRGISLFIWENEWW